ncbi:RluA family pseudouridine synthase [Candidatus Berkelbacteria bacterium]|nr:RluA family pseudouridine synthase [Candidatus Berkelbacteria bacterium]
MPTYQTIYEDEYVLIIDKPAGVEVAELPYPPAGGPAHRLDKDTSGLLVIAKNQKVLAKLQEQFKNRQVQKEYVALVYGEIAETGEIVTEIVRDPSRKVPFVAKSVLTGEERGNPRIAKTAWQTIKQIIINGQQITLLKIKITTGRTHQIRVHMKYLGHPILGDKVYYTKPSRELSKRLGLTRQFLHAAQLQFNHPVTNKMLALSSDLPNELQAVLE